MVMVVLHLEVIVSYMQGVWLCGSSGRKPRQWAQWDRAVNFLRAELCKPPPPRPKQREIYRHHVLLGVPFSPHGFSFHPCL